jgi:protein O-GlcNAc transferase
MSAAFHLEVYSHGGARDGVESRLNDAADMWHDIDGLDDEALAEKIREDEIDILINLDPLPASRLGTLALKPAPVQISWLGIPGTSGLSAIDYRISDQYLDPPGADECCYSERTWRLADSFCCFEPLTQSPPPIGPLPASKSGKITFGNLDDVSRLNGSVLALWARVMHAVPGSELVLLVQADEARARLRERLSAMGIGPWRVHFESSSDQMSYLRLYERIDVVLDTFPQSGLLTSLDALWRGVPVVTMRGKTAAGRVGVSLASNLGLPELVAADDADFVHVAGELARDRQRLVTLRASLRQRLQASPLMDAQRFSDGLAGALREMWRRNCGV